MKLKDLRAKGAFVKTGLVTKTIDWTHTDEETGETVTDTFTVQVKRQSFGVLSRALAGGIEGAPAALISECIVLGDNEVLSPADAFNLHPDLATLLVRAVNEVNVPQGKADAKNSLPPMSSGTT